MKKLTIIAISALFFIAPGAFSMDLDASIVVYSPAVSVQQSGNLTACANEYGLWLVDTSTPSQPQTAGFWGSVGLSEGVVVSGDFAYVCDGPKGVHIVDISDPTDITSPSDLSPVDYGSSAEIAGSYLFVNMGEDGLGIFDITSPDLPVHLTTYQTEGWVTNSTYDSDLIAVAVAGIGVDLLDGSDLSNPSLQSTILLQGNVTGLIISSNILFVLRAEFGLGIWNISDPANPEELSMTETGGYSTDMIFAGDNLVVADWLNGVQIFDISMLSRPELITDFDPIGFPSDLSCDGNTLALASGSNGIEYWDLTTPESPQILANPHLDGSSQDVYLGGLESLIYEAAGDAGLRVWDFSNPTNINLTANISTGGWANSIYASENWLYLSKGFAGIDILTRDSYPASTYEIDTDAYAGKVVMNADNDVFVSLGDDGFYGLNVESAGQLAEYGTTTTADYVHDLSASTELLITAEGSSGFEIFDLADPADPQYVTQVVPDGGAWAVLLVGDLAYIGTGWNGMEVYDVSLPESPATVGMVNDIGWVVDISEGPWDLINVSSGEAGLFAMSASGSSPEVYDTYDTPGTARATHQDFYYLVAADDNDIAVFELPLGVTDNPSKLPVEYTLQEPYPNPFNPSATIAFALQLPQNVDLAIFDLMGRQVATLWTGSLSAGEHRFNWQPAANISSGRYFVTLNAGGNHTVKPIVFLK